MSSLKLISFKDLSGESNLIFTFVNFDEIFPTDRQSIQIISQN